jgi:hypothetical protein
VIPESSIRDPRISEIWTRGFADPWFQGFAGPRSPNSHDFLIPYFRDLLAPDSHKNRISWNRSKVPIQGPCSAINSVSVQELAKHQKLIWTLHFAPFSQTLTFLHKAASRTCFINFGNLTFRGWQGFTEFPNSNIEYCSTVPSLMRHLLSFFTSLMSSLFAPLSH